MFVQKIDYSTHNTNGSILTLHLNEFSFRLFFSIHTCRAFAEGSIVDDQHLICLYMLSQLLERELDKCLRLVVAIPMDMSSFYGMILLATIIYVLRSKVVVEKAIAKNATLFYAQLHTESKFQIKADL